MSQIIDAHIHCSELENDELIRYARFNKLEYTLSELLRLMNENHVERGLLLSPPLRGKGIAPNTKIIDLCNKSEGRLYPVLTAEPTRQEISAVLKLARKYESFVKGFKVRLGYVRVYADDKIFTPIYDYAEKRKLPVLFHTGDTAFFNGSLAHSHPLTIDKLANVRRDLRIVICHFGNPWISDVAELIYKHPNVYADVSGLLAGDDGKYSSLYLESLASKISDAIYFAGGADKIIFGTDYPVETFSAGLRLVDRLQIEREDVEKILYTNAKEVFFSGC